MNTLRNKKLNLFVPIALAVIISISCGYFAGSRLSGKHSFYTGNKIDAILSIIDRQYVDTVNIHRLIETVATSLVNELDPHSKLISAEELQSVTDNLEGSFSGIGVSFTSPSDTILITSVISGGPAEKVGILPFDRIITIDDSTYAGKSITDTQIMRTLRGPKNTRVKLGIQRGGSPELIHFEVTRGDVPNYSVDVSYALGEIGYIKVNSFARTTYNEFITALAKLQKNGCSGYIIDLRGNRGGYLDIAIRMANEFLPSRRLIVYMEGQAYQRQSFYADGSGSFQQAPLVVLVDEMSGSASEVFAGTVQDNDRGLIIGRRTYGKGLVQNSIMMDDGSELRLTVARYYTPSGRCIQKMYEMGKSEEYDQDLNIRYRHGEFYVMDSIRMDESLQFSTLGGRMVYGGGGIMPDLFIPLDTGNVTSYYDAVINSGALYEFVLEYSERNQSRLSAYSSYKELYAYLKQQPLLTEFTDYAETKGIRKRPTLIQISGELIETAIHAYIIRNFFDSDGFYPVFQKDDSTILQAVKVIRDGTWKPDVS
ncbi:MAG: S41 family peptidase [Tannerella sp.]|jgi:carboxyl-terminal processing protease|nr:S41 family peptidase [Tannerella sp.]